MKHEGYNSLVGTQSYKYKYNGKELQETGMYDYGWRSYIPDLGRWIQVDPLFNDLDTSIDFDIENDDDDEVDMLLAFARKMEVGGGVFNTDNLNPYSYGYNNPAVYDDPDGRCPKCVKAILKTTVKSIAKGKLDLGEVYDAVDNVKTIINPNASLLDKGIAVFDLASPVSSKELKAGAKLLGVTTNAQKTVKKVNKNSNSAEGNFVLYKIKDANGNPLKVGKADADRKNAVGDPIRMKASERAAQKKYPGAKAAVIPGSQRNTSTGKMKDYEAETVRGERANGNSLPLNRERDKRYHNN